MTPSPLVGILMGSDSDFDVMGESARILTEFSVPFEMLVTSAHRTPERTHRYATAALDRGIRTLIVGAGAAAHLAGVVAAITPLPVIGVPLSATALQGMDALLATVQMPAGIPVATMAIGKAGAVNAALMAVRILALTRPDLADRLRAYHLEMAQGVEKKDQALRERLADHIGKWISH
ncbi:MAG: 5-(carboxyamino)imidazole ribonucleotide mutase [Magnetococcales bacterium]|nr:5-(carboxyamino)imidazole ribonucleotide mutase [Magnetococcales bacterium]